LTFTEQQFKPEDLLPHDELHKVKVMVDCKTMRGECAIWDDRRGCFMWVDIDGEKLYILNVATGHMKVVQFPQHFGSFALCESGKRILCALESDFAFYYFETDKLQFLKQETYKKIFPGDKDYRLNDGRCDRVGRFVCGPIDKEFKKTSQLYSCEFKSEEELSVKVIDGVIPFGCANSLCFSLDGATMHFADSLDKWIKTFPYDQKTGQVGEGKQFHKTPGEFNYPDGSCINSKGQLWNA